MSKLTELTPEQEAMLPGIRDEWLRHGLSTDPADRPAAEEGVRMAYRAAGLKPPRFILWADSPLSGAWMQAVAPTIIQSSDQVRYQVSGQVSGQSSDQVRYQVSGQVSGQVSDQVRYQVSGQVSGQVRGQVLGQVSGQVYGQVSGQVRGQVSGQVLGRLEKWTDGLNEFWGWGTVAYSAFIDTFRRFDLTGLDPWDGQSQIAKASTGWWWSFNGFAVLTERPVELHRDPQNRLHNETGPAIAYRDGFAVHCWHGRRVPADLIETGWDIARIFSEPNSEIRRCAIEKIGWDRFVTDGGMKLIAESDDPGNAPHKLRLYDLPKNLRDLYDAPARILICTNGSIERDGTRRKFGLPVPGHHKDPIEAAAELYGWPTEAYRRLEVRR